MGTHTLKFSNGSRWKNVITSLGTSANPANIQFPQMWLRLFPFSLMRVGWGCKALQSFRENPRGSLITKKSWGCWFYVSPKVQQPLHQYVTTAVPQHYWLRGKQATMVPLSVPERDPGYWQMMLFSFLLRLGHPWVFSCSVQFFGGYAGVL